MNTSVSDRRHLNAEDELRAAEQALAVCQHQVDPRPAFLACWRLAQAVIIFPGPIEDIQGRNYRYVFDELEGTLGMIHRKRGRGRGRAPHWILRKQDPQKLAAPIELLREFVRDASVWLASAEYLSIGQARKAALYKLADYRRGITTYEEFAASVFTLAERLCSVLLTEADDQYVLFEDPYATFTYVAAERVLVMTWTPSGESWTFIPNAEVPDEKLAWLIDAARNI